VHDIASDPHDAGSFELIHPRLVLEHLPTRLAVVEKLVAALCPGGWLVVEDLDFSGWLYLPVERLLCEPPEVGATFQAVIVAFRSIATAWDAESGRDLPIYLTNAGLDHVDGEA
jgi:2-polyprenyl-3-methyl-5-hydroxy-6-metoxy-1,4-benzoquinol methylase